MFRVLEGRVNSKPGDHPSPFRPRICPVYGTNNTSPTLSLIFAENETTEALEPERRLRSAWGQWLQQIQLLIEPFGSETDPGFCNLG
jgi:hypothetical protein